MSVLDCHRADGTGDGWVGVCEGVWAGVAGSGRGEEGGRGRGRRMLIGGGSGIKDRRRQNHIVPLCYTLVNPFTDGVV